MNEIDETISEIQQQRSRYQLVHFVIGQHDTPEMRFYQLMLEMQDTDHKISLAEIAVKKAEIEINRLLSTGDELDALDAAEKQIAIKQTKLALRGALREQAILQDIFESCEHYTRDEIEHAQPEYWQKRLTRQTNLQIMSGGVQWAQLDSMRQIGILDELIEAREVQLQEAARLELEQ
tara:strand:+ start:733 stop:1266 length:534 start_codon:yes stop_codon:yes gene_type:complete